MKLALCSCIAVGMFLAARLAGAQASDQKPAALVEQ